MNTIKVLKEKRHINYGSFDNCRLSYFSTKVLEMLNEEKYKIKIKEKYRKKTCIFLL